MTEFAKNNMEAIYTNMVARLKPDEVVVPKMNDPKPRERSLIMGLSAKQIRVLTILEVNDVINFLPGQLNPLKRDLLQQRINQIGYY